MGGRHHMDAPMPGGPPYGEMDRHYDDRRPLEPDGTGMGFDNSVVMVYGLNEDKFNVEKVFNLVCLYGNVFSVSQCFLWRQERLGGEDRGLGHIDTETT